MVLYYFVKKYTLCIVIPLKFVSRFDVNLELFNSSNTYLF